MRVGAGAGVRSGELGKSLIGAVASAMAGAVWWGGMGWGAARGDALAPQLTEPGRLCRTGCTAAWPPRR